MNVESERSRKTRARRLQAYGLYKSGKTIIEIAKEMGVKKETARGLVNDGGNIQKFLDKEEVKNQQQGLACPHCGKTIKVDVSITA